MTGPAVSPCDLMHVLARFPDQAVLIRRLAAEDPSFRAACDDYALARATLSGFERAPPSQRRTVEISDYLALVADLEQEIAQILWSAGRSL